MRSFLTVLGVVIGITALLSVVSILVGVYGDVNAYLSDFGSETLFIFRFDPGIHTGRLTPDERARKPLTLEDAEAIAQLCPAVRAVTASVYPRWTDEGPSRGPVTARYRGKEVSGIDYNGTLPSNEEVFNSRPRTGRFFSDAENMHRADVAVIGPDIAKTLYPDMDPLGKPIQIDGVSYEVIGVLEPRKCQLVKDQSADKAVMVPYRTYHKHIPQDDENMIGAVAYPGRMSEAEDQIRGVLRRRRNVPYSKPDNFWDFQRSGDRRSVSSDYLVRGPSDFRHQLHRTPGRRRRRNEHHADVRHAAHPRNRSAQGHRRAPPRRHLAISHRSRCAYGRGRRYRRASRWRHQPAHQLGGRLPAVLHAAMRR